MVWLGIKLLIDGYFAACTMELREWYPGAIFAMQNKTDGLVAWGIV